MAIEDAQPFRGVADPDVAWMDIQGGLTLYVWSTPTQVRGTIYITHEQGQQTIVWDGVVEDVQADRVECTRCVSVADQYFVVYWLDRDDTAGTYTLESRYVDMEDTDGGVSWQSNSTITPDDAGLYDVKQIENAVGTGEYMLAWATSTTEVVVRRVDGPDHTTDVAWSTTVTTNHADRVLAVHGDGQAAANDGGVVVVVQDTDNDLRAFVLDHSDGTSLGGVDIFAGTTREYACVGIARSSSVLSPTTTRVAVIAEFFDTDIESEIGFTVTEDDYVHYIVAVEVSITGFSGTTSNPHITKNLSMLSKPYSYVDAEGTRSVYCGLGYKTINYPDSWAQNVGFVCDMGLQEWTRTSHTVHPRPVLTLPLANVDSDIHAYSPEASALISGGLGKRMNHLSNWIEGPKALLCDTRKSRTVAWANFAKITSVGAGDGRTVTSEPAGAMIRAVVHYLEDPWTRNRDDTESSSAPTRNFHGCNPLSLYDNTTAQDSLLIAGGTPQLYDGKFIVELGFPWVPEIVMITDDTVTVGSIGNGTYKYLAVYEWQDAQGYLHRSGHGIPVEYDNDGTNIPTIVIRTLTIGNRVQLWLYPTMAPVVIALYRNTLDTPNRYFRLHATEATGFTPADIPINDPSVWAIGVLDNVNDQYLWNSTDSLALAPELNFVADGAQQSQFPPFQPPAAHVCAVWRNRAWLVSSEKPREIWYSYPLEGTAALGGLAPEFTPFFIYRADVVKGDITGLVPADDQLFVFTRDGIYSLTGDGAYGLGVPEATLSLQVVHEGTGCIEPRSIVKLPQGILFQSYRGIYLLARGSSDPDYISAGAPIEDLIRTAGNIRSATYLEDRHTVALVANSAVTDGPQVIKWDVYHRQWSTAELEPPNTTAWLSSTAAGCSWRGNERDVSHAVLCQGNLLIERGKDDSTPYLDETDAGADSIVRVDIETGWIHFAGIAGHVRTWEIGISLGDHAAGGAIDCQVDTDRFGDYSLAAPVTYGFGTGGLEGYLPIKPRVQRMTAFRLRLQETTDADNEAALVINGFSVVIGVQKGLRRVNSATRGVVP